MMETTTPGRWSLADLLPEPVEKALQDALAALQQDVAAFVAKRDLLADDIVGDTFLALLREYEELTDRARRLSAYGALFFSEDTQNQTALNRSDRINETLVELTNRTLYFDLWLKGLPQATAERLAAAAADYRYYLESLRKFTPHTLSENEEQIINLKDAEGIDAIVRLYEMLTSAFTFELEVDGEKKTLSRDQLSVYYRHPDPAVRAATYHELYRVFAANSTVLAQMYNHRVRDWRNVGRLRDFSEPIAYRNLANDLPDEVVQTLLDVCAANSDVFQRYFELKAGWLGMDKLRRYDIYAPLVSADKKFAYGAAVELVLSSFEEFSPEVAQLAQQVFTANHIDAAVRPGKRGGAFCYGPSPGLTPWVLVNYAGDARDVATLAHELGHAIHDLLASEQTPLNYHPTLPLAETASVFAEMVLTDRLLAQESDPAVRRDLLAAAIDDAYATVQRQAFFTLFEREAHALIDDGATVDQLCAAYMGNLRDQFGEAVELSDEFQWEWISIPHFYNVPFYTYAYSFGQLMVLSLYRQYQQEGASFIPRLLKILSYGGSEAPAVVLEEAGFDISDPAFWQGGYDVLREMIASLEELEV